VRAVGVTAILALGIVGMSLLAEAQQPSRVPKVGYLLPGAVSAPSAPRHPNLTAFLNGLRELGYVDGRNIVIEYRYAERRFDRFPNLAAELVRLKVDVIVCAGGPASLYAARDATRSIPIVMITSARDPVSEGLVASLARPGGNITGLTQLAELFSKRLELLKEAVPALARVGHLWDLNIGPYAVLKTTEDATRSLGLELIPYEVRGAGDFEAAFEAAVRQRVGAVVVSGTPLTSTYRDRIAALAVKHGLPAISSWRYHADAGLLMTYGPHLPDLYRRAASYVDKILKGAKPAELPVEQPTRFEMVLNLKAAKTLGLTLPQSLLIRADDVIQ